MLGAGQPVDIMYSSPGTLPFTTYAQQKAFYPLEDLLKKDFIDLYNAVPEETWNGVTVDGHIYAVVPFKDLSDTDPIMYDKVITDKYNVKMPESGKWTSLYEWVDFMYAMHDARNKEFPEAAKNPSIVRSNLAFAMFSPHEQLVSMAGVTIPGLEGFQGKGNGDTVFNIYDTPEYLKFCQTMRKLVADGLYPNDILNWLKANPGTKIFEVTKYLWDMRQGEVLPYKDVNANFEINESAYKVMSTGYIQAMLNTISANSKNPARALEVLNMVNMDPQLRTTLSFGVENVDWKKSGSDSITFEGTKNADPKNRSYYHYYGAQWGGIQSLFVPDNVDTTFKSKIKELNEKANRNSNLGFAFNPEPVQNQIASCANVISQYDAFLKYGMVEDVEKTVKEFVSKLKENGSEAIVAEAQKQLTAWRTASGKK
jgi:putative aldouronate transport system substrate-binding protein